MSTTDFLLHNQPTASTVRVLWYLHNFFQKKMWQDGLAYEQELRNCRLDYSPDSLRRIDDLIYSIRQNHPENIETFFADMSKQNFMSVLAFYCGETVGRARHEAAVWQQYDEYASHHPEIEHNYPPALWTDFFAEFRHYDGTTQLFFPLKSICGGLFGSEDGEESIFQSAAVLMPPETALEDPLPEPPPQSLDFSIRYALSATAKEQLPYLQMLPPNGSATSPLSLQIDALGTLYRQGRVVWAAAINPEPALSESGNTRPTMVDIVYDPTGRTDIDTLRQAARSLALLNHNENDNNEDEDNESENTDDNTDTTPTHETSQNSYAQLFHRIPAIISHMPLQTTPLFTWLPHLPDGVLRLPIFPILIDESTRATTLLPARYWSHTQHYRDWLNQADPKVPAETAPAFNALLEEEPNFWQNYPELIRPLLEELPDLGHFPEPYTNTDSKLGRRLIKNYRTAAQSSYPRFAEDLPTEEDILQCVQELKDGQPTTYPERVEKYARLRLSDFSSTLMELSDSAANRLLNQQPIPDAVKMLTQDTLNPYQASRFVNSLMKQSKRTTTAAVYLAYLYTIGRFVPQSLCEAAAWAHQASDAGDWRAGKLLAEILLAVPETAPELYYETISNDTYVILSDLKQAGLSTKEIEQQKKAYLNNRQAVLETIRRHFLRAIEQGDPIAQVRLKQLIESDILPADIPDARYTGIKNWLAIYAENQNAADPPPVSIATGSTAPIDSKNLLKKPSADTPISPKKHKHRLKRILLLVILLAALACYFYLASGQDVNRIFSDVQRTIQIIWRLITKRELPISG